jgi:uncharacterized glyoxalase superfamily protein PhnB
MENTVGPGPTQIQQRSINYKNKEMFKPFYQETLEQKQAKNREKRKKKKKEKVGENKKKKENLAHAWLRPNTYTSADDDGNILHLFIVNELPMNTRPKTKVGRKPHETTTTTIRTYLAGEENSKLALSGTVFLLQAK